MTRQELEDRKIRSIKFRAWDGNCMISHDDLFSYSRHYNYILNALGINGIYCFQHSDYVLMQFTGLSDKNGKEIYEGDVVKFNQEGDNFQWIGQIVFEDFSWRVKNNDYRCVLNRTENCKILGNIHENKELLK